MSTAEATRSPSTPGSLSESEIRGWLQESEPAKLQELWRWADGVRLREVGDAVYLRGLVEIANHCRETCLYCGLRAPNRAVKRYRLDDETIMTTARETTRRGYGTLVLQAGEDPGLDAERIGGLISRIKRETDLAVTLSLGERSVDDLCLWRAAGADRYLLRFESSSQTLRDRLRPSAAGRTPDRLDQLETLRSLGYEVGSGFLVGVPGQTLEDLARDIALAGSLNLHMVGVGPWIPDPDTPLWDERHDSELLTPTDRDGEVPPGLAFIARVISLTRLACPRANMPATTALETLAPGLGWRTGLACGANVLMPTLTPAEARAAYRIYPSSLRYAASRPVTPEALIRAAGRRVGSGRGDSPAYVNAPRRCHRERVCPP